MTTKRCSEMAFAVDERVITHYCTEDPLVNGESHFTASFGGSWFTNCTCNFYCSLTVPMARMKQSGDRNLKHQDKKENHPSGEQLQQGSPTGHHSCLRGQVHLEIPLTKVCLECIHCYLKEYTGWRCRRLN